MARPIPTPTKLKIIRGNPGRRPLNKKEPQPRPGVRCPQWLSKEARREWRRVAPELKRLGLLSKIDKAALVGYCESWAQYMEAIEFLHKHGTCYPIYLTNKEGDYITDKDGKKVLKYMQQFPQVSIANKALNNVRAFCAEFGFSPSARAKLEVPDWASPPRDTSKYFG